MAKATWVKVGGVWKKVKTAWIKVNGVWKEKAAPKINVGGTWKDIMAYLFSGKIYASSSAAAIEITDAITGSNDGRWPGYATSAAAKICYSPIDDAIIALDSTGVRKYNRSGTLLWTYAHNLTTMSCIAVNKDGIVAIGGSTSTFSRVIFLEANGTHKRTEDLSQSRNTISLDAMQDGNFVICETSGIALHFDIINVKRTYYPNSAYLVGAANDQGGTEAFLSTSTGKLRKVNSSLIVWEADSPTGKNFRPIAVTNDSIFAAIAFNDKGLCRISKDGVILKQITTTAPIIYDMVATPDNCVYVKIYTDKYYIQKMDKDFNVIWTSAVPISVSQYFTMDTSAGKFGAFAHLPMWQDFK